MRVVRLLLAAALVAALGASACTSSDDEKAAESSSTEESRSVDESGGGAPPAASPESEFEAWLTGTWTVQFTLNTVEPDVPVFRDAADQPMAEWDCRIRGGQAMTIRATRHTYEGDLTVAADGAWHYDAIATWTDPDYVWTSHIIVDGTRNADDTFTIEQWGEISSDSEGVLYTATWTGQGTKIE